MGTGTCKHKGTLTASRSLARVHWTRARTRTRGSMGDFGPGTIGWKSELKWAWGPGRAGDRWVGEAVRPTAVKRVVKAGEGDSGRDGDSGWQSGVLGFGN